MEEYVDELIEASQEAEHVVEKTFDARTVALTSPFRAPSFAPAHRHAQDAARILSRGHLPTAWCFRCYPGAPSFRINAVVPTLPPLVAKPRGVDGDAVC